MRRAWLIACKDLRESLGRRKMLLQMMVSLLLLPLIYGVIAGRGWSDGSPNFVGRNTSFVLALCALMGTFAGVSIAADAIAGEKERRTIEPLLATPVSDLQIFLGKTLASVIPSICGGCLCGLVFLLTVSVVSGGRSFGLLRFAGAPRLILLAMPIVATMFASVAIVISARSSSVAAAAQTCGFLCMPLIAGVVYLSMKGHGWPLSLLLAALLPGAAIAVILLILGARALGREELVARLD